MRFKSKLVLILVFIIMSFSAFAVKSNKKEDVKMPNIVLYDQYGKKHNIEEYKGKVVVINFWATWCGYCVQEMPEFEKVYKEFGSNKKDVIILGVAGPKSKENQNNVDVEKDKVISFLKKKNITYPSLMDETGKSFDDYKVRALPMTYVINKDGYLEGFVSGAITADQLKKAVNDTLKK
ncbi:TlpA disulfide reductase family protein [uncultured Fusobacterium sp.]|mgnify:FL=1|uniref:TlpA family protein disulfide reductase n=1 Tax=uncultured Fusobacterium sp. TaxID=159267 RepID=UPI00263444A9|nr:TlpA disulfide reductase family protein [uncultured Fusobacterium sp.]